MTSLRELWDNQFADEYSSELTKEAAVHGLTPDEYLQAVAYQEAQQEELYKQAAENEVAEGLIVAQGMKEGIANEFAKFAALGGDATACGNLMSLFVK